MRQSIGIRETEAAYSQAVSVWQKEISEADARKYLTDSFNMNNASASDLIRNFAQLLKGEEYHRTLSLLTTRYYFEQIYADFGSASLLSAIRATYSHIAYYENLPTGGGQPGLLKLCSEFEKIANLGDESDGTDPLENLQSDLQRDIDRSKKDTSSARNARLERADGKSEKVVVQTTAYRRNADVIAERLSQANGVCDHCNKPAPFIRKNGDPYLEVHHTIPLSEHGEDVLSNTMALCPNCHKEAHFGENWKEFRAIE